MGILDALLSNFRGFQNSSNRNAYSVYAEKDDAGILHVIADVGQGVRFEINKFDPKSPSAIDTYSVSGKLVSLPKLVPA